MRHPAPRSTPGTPASGRSHPVHCADHSASIVAISGTGHARSEAATASRCRTETRRERAERYRSKIDASSLILYCIGSTTVADVRLIRARAASESSAATRAACGDWCETVGAPEAASAAAAVVAAAAPVPEAPDWLLWTQIAGWGDDSSGKPAKSHPREIIETKIRGPHMEV
jgi:hypothetical protein